MTTIAYKEGFMASDTQMTRGSEPVHGITKAARIVNWLVGVAGNAHDIEAVFHWAAEVQCDKLTPERLHECTYFPSEIESDILIVDEHGRIFSIDRRGYSCRVHRDYDAIGSGAEYAVGAMAFGADAEDAIHVAMKHDINSGGWVSVFALADQRVTEVDKAS